MGCEFCCFGVMILFWGLRFGVSGSGFGFEVERRVRQGFGLKDADPLAANHLFDLELLHSRRRRVRCRA